MSNQAMHDVIQKIDDGITDDLIKLWGGRLPTWEEFKAANKRGRVRANKNIGIKAIGLQGVPKSFWILYGVLTASAVLVVPIACILLSILGVIEWWYIIVSFFVSLFLYKLTLEGAAEAIKCGAEKDEALYWHLVRKGAFLFDPEEIKNEAKWRTEFEESGETEIRDALSHKAIISEPKRKFAVHWLREKEKSREFQERQMYRYVQRTFWMAFAAALISFIGILTTWLH
jgi:hypothetical protein